MSKYKKLKEYHIRKGRYPFRLSLTLWDDGISSPFIDLYSGCPSPKGYKHNHVKISSKIMWDKIKKIIDYDLISEIKKGKPLSAKALDKLELEEIEILKKDNFRLKKRLQSHSKLIKEYRRINLPKYKKDIKEFQKLLDISKKEEELQSFLSTRTWLLGLEYETSTPQNARRNSAVYQIRGSDIFYTQNTVALNQIPQNSIYDALRIDRGKAQAPMTKVAWGLTESPNLNPVRLTYEDSVNLHKGGQDIVLPVWVGYKR